MKITVLAENTISNKCHFQNELKAEHGLSLLIETENLRILHDMGQSDLFCKNAEILGIDLSTVDFAFLSHGHYDHGGGLETFLMKNQTTPVYLNENAFSQNYNATEKYIGLDKSLLENPITQNRFIYIKDEYSITPDFSVFSCNTWNKTVQTQTDGLKQFIAGKFIPENFNHEHYLLINENGKKILITGCSHKGILNLTEWFKPDVLIGGFHLKSLNVENEADSNELKNIALSLKKYPTKFYTCHCTGKTQFTFLKELMQNQLDYISTGDTIFI